MWLRVPDHVENVLWEGSLVPATDKAVEQMERGWAKRGITADAKDAVRDLPIVTIGQPEVWPLAAAYPPDQIPYPLKSMLAAADFYLVRLACSFRLPHKAGKTTRIEWARFKVDLPADAAGNRPTAFDLYPLLVTQEIKHTVKIAISPSLKFQQVEASLGSQEFGFEYPELQPIISASGVGESVDICWDYEAPQGVHIQGSRFMHILVKAPKGMTRGEAVLDLAADLLVHGVGLPALLPPSREREGIKQPSVVLWG